MSRVFRSIFILMLLSLVAVFCSAAEPSKIDVTVDTNRRTYVLGDKVQISLNNKTGEKIFVPGCQSIQVERFGDDQYELLPGEHCVAEGNAREVEPGKSEFLFQPREEHLGPPHRVSMVFGIGCTQQRPLSQARCRDFGTVYTQSFRVREEPGSGK